MPAARVAVFLDYQNVYQAARRAFGWQDDRVSLGQINPRSLGELIVGRDAGRVLHEVRVYRGRPAEKSDPRGYSASQRQLAMWERLPNVTTITRDLRYPFDWPNSIEKPQEKGIDVALAIDFVALAIHKSFDIGVIFSADTDLKPALEAVCELDNGTRCEVAAWSPNYGHGRRLAIKRHNLWCHWLTEADYRLAEDSTNYARRRR